MSFATGARSGFSFITETVYGTTPSTPTMQDLPITGHRLNLEKQIVNSAVIRPDRMGGVVRHGQRNVTGTIEGEMRADAFDALLESAMMSAFSSGVVNIGTTLKSFSFEDRMADIAMYRKFTGCTVDKFSLRAQPNSLIGLSFGMVGQDQASNTSTPLGTSYNTIAAAEPFDSYRIVLSEGGSAIAKVSALNFTLDNQIDPAFVVGSVSAPQMLNGMAKLSGEMTVYVDNTTLLQKFINETESAISLQCDDEIKRYTFLLPRVKYTGGNLSLENDQARLLTLPFEALRDETTGTMLRITKVTL